jgi:ABC-type transport system substrate-binding protein
LEQAIIQQDAAWIPLFSRQHYFAVSKRVDGFRVSWNGWSSNRYSDVAVLEEQ